MAEYLAPGVYVEEVPSSIKTIEGSGTSTAGFVGVAERGPLNEATLITSLTDFNRIFGRPLDIRQRYYLGYAVEGFFREGGTRCYVVRVAHYTNILDRASTTAVAASASFSNASATPVLGVEASSPGQWGASVSVALQSSSKFATTLSASLSASTVDRIPLRSADGVVPGTLLWVVRPIFATVTYSGGTLNLQRASIAMDPDGAGLVDGAIIPTDSLVITPDFRFMARLTGAITLAPSDPTPAWSNTSAGITLPNNDVFDRPLPEGQVLWIVEPDRSALAVVSRVEGSTAILANGVTIAQTFAANTKVLARDYRLLVRDQGALVEVHDHLSTLPANGADWAPNRLNSGRGASSRVRLDATTSSVPMANSAFRALSTTDDGLTDLSRLDYVGSPVSRTGIFAFDGVEDVNTLAIAHPRFNLAGDLDGGVSSEGALVHVYRALAAYCQSRSYLFCVVDCRPGLSSTQALAFRNAVGASSYAAFYYPWLRIRPERESRDFDVPPSGWVAGLYAYTDARRGVHKAPAGTGEGRVKSVSGIERVVVAAEQDGLNNNGVDVIRSFASSGVNLWGARTIASDPEWKYINVRRLMSYLEKSIDSGTQWAVFEPNDLALWKKLERNVKDFLRTVWRSGALFGETENQAFFVRCDAETNSPESIEAGQVITEIGVAPVTPAEFVIFRISQSAAGASVSE